ncbi:mast cell carboxypeptidase A isoform X1 [Macadamia integrifolia]|uniref:mast cell carboxypeptidase A isoform X1 n=1 Tax=Macadamia integrifolia TaxID=60698 RepID=UPI001C4EAF4A|nr:mast cell carboxypeptidase A isoform X1 [Macadamia integrifolia]
MGSLASCSFLLLFLGLLQLSSLINGRNLSDPSFTPIRHDLYHSSEALIKEIKALVGRHPERLSMEAIRTGNKGYYAEVLVVTYGHFSKEINDSSKIRILLSFGQHGRELITSEVAFRLLSILSGEKSIPKIDPISLNRTLEKLVIKVVPMENLSGRRLVEAGDLCERRNGRGVDLNRNWSVDWGKKEKDYDPYEENPGVAPFSEPETQIMRKISKSFNPHIWVNVHSGMEALFMPYDHRNTTPDGSSSDIMRMMLKDLNHLHCHDRCSIGSGGGSVGYLAHGTATDYMYDIVKVPMAFTFEIYGDVEASSKDCFKMFNPIDLSTFNRVLNNWCAAFLTIFQKGPHHLGFISGSSANLQEWISINDYLDGYLMERSSRYGKKKEVLELGMQEIRTYFRLFLLSSVLLLFMFCSRISKAKYSRSVVSGMPF